MADKRVFTIEIDGIKKSYDNANQLLTVLSKVESSVKELNKTTKEASKEVEKSTKTTAKRASALSDEEKAAKKLAETQEKATRVITANERAQALASLQLRERTREIQLQVKAQNAANNSLEEMQTKLSQLRAERKKLDVLSEGYANLTQKIDELNSKLKTEDAKSGDYGRDVGNYSKFTKELEGNLNNLSNTINTTTKATSKLFTAFQTGVTVYALLSDENKTINTVLSQTSKILAALMIVQKLNNGVTSSQVVLNKIRVVVDALVTRGIISQTVAQTALNIATKAFPFALLIAGIAAGIAVIANFTRSTKEATESQKQMNDAIGSASSETGKLFITYTNLQRQWNSLSGDLKTKQKFVDDNKEAFKSLGLAVNDVNDAQNVLVTNSPAVIAALRQQTLAIAAKTLAEQKAQEYIKAKTLADEMSDTREVDYITNSGGGSAGATITTSKKTIRNNFKDDALAEAESIKKEMDKYLDQVDTINEEIKDKLSDAGITTVSQTAKTISDTTRTVSDQTKDYTNDIINEQIKLIDDAKQKEIATLNQTAKQRLAAIKGNSNQEIELRKLIEENLQKEIDKVNDKYETERQKKEEENAKKELDNRKQYLDVQYREIQTFYQDISNLKNQKNQDGLTLDTDALRANNQEVNTLLAEYISSLQLNYNETEKYYDNMLALYKADSIEFLRINEEKQRALRELIQLQALANGEIVSNTKTTNDTIVKAENDKMQLLSTNLQYYGSQVLSIYSTLNSLAQGEIDQAREKLDEVNEAYDAITQKKEESDQRIIDLQNKALEAGLNRSNVFQEQIAAEMEANKALANQQNDLAKQKEKLEAEIDKKEKKQKKAAAAQQVLQAGVNTAVAITAALPNITKAIIVGAMGAAQTAVAAANYSKMEKGGLLDGKRHAQGGMKIEGTNIEVEGGEYVVNRKATAQNLDLLEVMNSTNQRIPIYTPPANMINTPLGIPDAKQIIELDSTSLADAFKEVTIKPTVSVVDINAVNDTVVGAEEWNSKPINP